MAVLWILTIGIGLASAMDPTQSPGQCPFEKGHMHPGFELTNATIQQQMISRFEEQGIDTSGLKAAFASGNENDVKTWLDAHRPTHPGGHRHNGQGDNNSTSKSCIQEVEIPQSPLIFSYSVSQ